MSTELEEIEEKIYDYTSPIGGMVTPNTVTLLDYIFDANNTIKVIDLQQNLDCHKLTGGFYSDYGLEGCTDYKITEIEDDCETIVIQGGIKLNGEITGKNKLAIMSHKSSYSSPDSKDYHVAALRTLCESNLDKLIDFDTGAITSIKKDVLSISLEVTLHNKFPCILITVTNSYGVEKRLLTPPLVQIKMPLKLAKGMLDEFLYLITEDIWESFY